MRKSGKKNKRKQKVRSMGCDILIVGVNSLTNATFEKAAKNLCQLLNNQSSATNQSVLFQIPHSAKLLTGDEATCASVRQQVYNLGKRCAESKHLALFAFFGEGSGSVSSLQIKCSDGLLQMYNDVFITITAAVERACFILDCDNSSSFVNVVRQHSLKNKVAIITSTQTTPLCVAQCNVFAHVLLWCSVTDLEYAVPSLQKEDLIVPLALWFETSQARFAKICGEQGICGPEIEFFISPNFSFAETIIAHNRLFGADRKTLLVGL